MPHFFSHFPHFFRIFPHFFPIPATAFPPPPLSNGGDVGDDRPQFPFVGPGSAPPPSLLSGACLLSLLSGHQVPASSERENPSVSPAGRFRSLFRCLFLVNSVMWCPFPMGFGGVRAGAQGVGCLVRPLCSTLVGAAVGVPFPVPVGRTGSHPGPLVGDGGRAGDPPVVVFDPSRARWTGSPMPVLRVCVGASVRRCGGPLARRRFVR